MKTECVLWPGAKDKDGYGFVKIKGKNRKSHRVALEMKIGRKLTKKEFSMHLCHTPSCVNPDHLVVGDVKQNNLASRKRKITLADRFLSGWQVIYK